jgi:hypothetical protein
MNDCEEMVSRCEATGTDVEEPPPQPQFTLASRSEASRHGKYMVCRSHGKLIGRGTVVVGHRSL